MVNEVGGSVASRCLSPQVMYSFTNQTGPIDDLGPEFNFEAWPFQSDTAKEEAKKLRYSHKIQPLVAFDQEGDIIKPSQYRRQLCGATVLARFVANHYAIGKAAKPGGPRPLVHSFTGEIVDLTVLVSPPAPARSPLKRSGAMLDVTSPVKKRKTS